MTTVAAVSLFAVLVGFQEQPTSTERRPSATPESPLNSATFGGIRPRLIGPAVSSGRVVAFAVHPKNKANYFVAVGSGGVWKTTNAGTTFTPVFDNEGSYSIGTILLDPKNPNIVWVGTGENNSQRSVGYGDGVYKSEDAGRTWRNAGLKTSEHIGRIAIDPRDSNVVYVAAQGPLWGPGGERGLYKTTDGGKTWKQVLKISDDTGVTDVQIDPSNPDTLLAAAWQRRRHFYTLVNGGPESAIHKSTDGGTTWRKIRGGLPAGEMGRIGLATSPVQTGLVFARVEANVEGAGIYRSADFGESWQKMSSYVGQAMYYGQIYPDPKNVNRLYFDDVQMRVSDDQGRTTRAVGERRKHVDNHALWIDPNDTDFLLVGCDGGIYESYDGGRLWHYKSNLPITQFYDITVDNSKPFYYVYGGTQDNATWGGPSRTKSSAGVVNADWFVTTFGDGFRVRVDPEDPNIVYSESQHGVLVRFDKRTFEAVGIKPIEAKGEAPYRWNWDTPLMISPHSHTRIYFGSQFLFRSDDRGNSWKKVSPDLTRAVDRDKLPVFGKIVGIDSIAKNQSTAQYSNLSAIAESPKKEGLLYTGSDDGIIQVSENSGGQWKKIESFPGVPAGNYVRRIVPSQHSEGTVYAAFDNHQNSDFKPYLLKSTDKGGTWTSIAGDLPERGTIYAFAEDHVNPDLLFCGTEFGLYFTIDGGKKWIRVRSGMPTIAVRDLAIQKRDNDLVVGTFGRGIYIVDNYAPLREIKPAVLEQESVLFKPRNELLYIESNPYGTRGPGMLGESFYNAPNPAYGITFTYYLKDSYKTLKQKRQEAERGKKDLPIPSRQELTAEADEEAPSVILTITDAQNHVVRRLTGANAKGIQRTAWDFRTASPTLGPPGGGRGGGGGGGGDDDDSFPPPSGHVVLPGTYKVQIAKRVGGVVTPLGTPQTFEVLTETPLAKETIEFHTRLDRLRRVMAGAMESANSAKQRIVAARRAIQESTADLKLRDDATALDSRITQILRKLRGNETLSARYIEETPSVQERLQGAAGELRRWLGPPTKTQEDSVKIATEELQQELSKIRVLVDTDLKKLEREMDAAGVPHTPGRIPELR
jgi:photosystem II stability/assembly factor-like uncharacterized protein